MENVFESVLGTNTTETQSEESTTSTPTLGDEYNLELPDDNNTAEEQEEDTQGEVDDEEEDESPTNQAFAQMRTQNKEYLSKINELDAIAKAAGLQGVDDLIAKSKEAQIKKAAKDQGIPEAVARELAEFKKFKEQYEQDKTDSIYRQKEQTLVTNLQTFIEANKLSQNVVDKMSDDLARDGFTTDKLMEYPKSALNRILNAYLGVDIQKNLERKDAIKNELPLNQSSKADIDTVNKQIDELARQFAGKI